MNDEYLAYRFSFGKDFLMTKKKYLAVLNITVRYIHS